jgi:hypothetical protein
VHVRVLSCVPNWHQFLDFFQDMPPKKGKKDVAAKLSDKENLARAETEILSLQRLLELRSHEVREYACVRLTLLLLHSSHSLIHYP